MAKEKGDGMHFISVVPLERGIVEFEAWENARWLGIWQRPYNIKTTRPYLIFENYPAGRQIIYRFLILEGLAALPTDEKFSPLQFVWQTRKSFASLWISTSCQGKRREPDRGATVAKEVRLEKEIPDEITAYAK